LRGVGGRACRLGGRVRPLKDAGGLPAGVEGWVSGWVGRRGYGGELWHYAPPYELVERGWGAERVVVHRNGGLVGRIGGCRWYLYKRWEYEWMHRRRCVAVITGRDGAWVLDQRGRSLRVHEAFGDALMDARIYCELQPFKRFGSSRGGLGG
jgi:hypothetical protein